MCTAAALRFVDESLGVCLGSWTNKHLGLGRSVIGWQFSMSDVCIESCFSWHIGRWVFLTVDGGPRQQLIGYLAG